MSAGRLTDRIEVICWLSVDVAREELIDGRTSLLEHGQHQVALTEQVEELMAALGQDLAQLLLPGRRWWPGTCPSLPITREMSARPRKALVVWLTSVPFRSWLPTLRAFSSWGRL